MLVILSTGQILEDDGKTLSHNSLISQEGKTRQHIHGCLSPEAIRRHMRELSMFTIIVNFKCLGLLDSSCYLKVQLCPLGNWAEDFFLQVIKIYP